MGYYHEGYNEARQWVMAPERTEEELLGTLDSLYGRDELPEGYTLEDVRMEALDQTRRDFTDHIQAAKLMARQKGADNE